MGARRLSMALANVSASSETRFQTRATRAIGKEPHDEQKHPRKCYQSNQKSAHFPFIPRHTQEPNEGSSVRRPQPEALGSQLPPFFQTSPFLYNFRVKSGYCGTCSSPSLITLQYSLDQRDADEGSVQTRANIQKQQVGSDVPVVARRPLV